jgi:hypothetical protein
MRTVAGFGTSQGTPQRAAAVMRVSCKFPNTKRPSQRTSRKDVGDRPDRHLGRTVKGGAQ